MYSYLTGVRQRRYSCGEIWEFRGESVGCTTESCPEMYYSRIGERRGLTRILGACLVRENGSGRVRRTVAWVNGVGLWRGVWFVKNLKGCPGEGRARGEYLLMVG